jgi:hypothetical protein
MGQFVSVAVLFGIFSMAVQILVEFLANALKFEKTDDAIVCRRIPLITVFPAMKLFRMLHEKIMHGTYPFSNVPTSAIYNLRLFLPILLGVYFI